MFIAMKTAVTASQCTGARRRRYPAFSIRKVSFFEVLPLYTDIPTLSMGLYKFPEILLTLWYDGV